MLKGSAGRNAVGASSKLTTAHSPFDMVLSDNIFQRVKPPSDEKYMIDALNERDRSLTPSDDEKAALDDLVTKVKGMLEGFSSVLQTFESVSIVEAPIVGSFSMGTILAGHGIADIVIVLKSFPLNDTVFSIAQKITGDLQSNFPNEIFGCSRHVRGAEISSSNAAIRILPASVADSSHHDPQTHLDRKYLEGHMTSVRHTKWFEENAYHVNVKILTRIIRDMKNRIEGFASLNPWLISLLAHYCVMNNPDRQPLPINVAFKRCLQLLAAGFFLPTSTGIVDPCESGTIRAHMVLQNHQMDRICCTAQTLIRINSHGGIRYILGLELHPNILEEASEWNGIVVSPSDRVLDSGTTGDV